MPRASVIRNRADARTVGAMRQLHRVRTYYYRGFGNHPYTQRLINSGFQFSSDAAREAYNEQFTILDKPEADGGLPTVKAAFESGTAWLSLFVGAATHEMAYKNAAAPVQVAVNNGFVAADYVPQGASAGVTGDGSSWLNTQRDIVDLSMTRNGALAAVCGHLTPAFQTWIGQGNAANSAVNINANTTPSNILFSRVLMSSNRSVAFPSSHTVAMALRNDDANIIMRIDGTETPFAVNFDDDSASDDFAIFARSGGGAPSSDRLVAALLLGEPMTSATERANLQTWLAGWKTQFEALDNVAPPSITGFSPSTASIGASVSVTGGDNLNGVSSVTVGGIPATVTANTKTTLTFTVPSGVSAGVNSVVITTSGGTTSANLTVTTELTLEVDTSTEQFRVVGQHAATPTTLGPGFIMTYSSTASFLSTTGYAASTVECPATGLGANASHLRVAYYKIAPAYTQLTGNSNWISYAGGTANLKAQLAAKAAANADLTAIEGTSDPLAVRLA